MIISATSDAVGSDLHDCTSRLRALVDSLLSPSAPVEASPRVTSPEEMSTLLSELMHAGQSLQRVPQYRNSELECQVGEYRIQVDRLRTLLPMIQAALLAERARLECERERVNSTAEWMRTSRQTL